MRQARVGVAVVCLLMVAGFATAGWSGPVPIPTPPDPPKTLAWTCIFDGSMFPENAPCRWVARGFHVLGLATSGTSVTFSLDAIVIQTANVGAWGPAPPAGEQVIVANGIIGSSHGYAWWDSWAYGTP